MPERKHSTVIIGSVAHTLLRLFARYGGMPGFTTGDLITRSGLHSGTAVHQRMTIDLRRRCGWQIVKVKDKDGVFRYWMPPRERERAKAFLQKLAAQMRAKEFASLKRTA